MTAAIGVGGLLGALGAFTLGGRRLAVVFGVALVFWGLPIALMAPTSFLVTALLLLAVVGAANSIEDVASFTLLQRIVPDDVLARAFGAIWGLAMGGVALGSIFAPAVVSLFGAQAALIVVGMPCSETSRPAVSTSGSARIPNAAFIAQSAANDALKVNVPTARSPSAWTPSWWKLPV